jgi:hypothetical protein
MFALLFGEFVGLYDLSSQLLILHLMHGLLEDRHLLFDDGLFVFQPIDFILKGFHLLRGELLREGEALNGGSGTSI